MPLDIKTGDHVEIVAKHRTYAGEVYSAFYLGEKAGWDIVLKEPRKANRFAYWRQRYDGGFVTKVNGVPVALVDVDDESPIYEKGDGECRK